ncbi:MAG: FAD-binding protein [Armatimonadetes bacterium]|nr:FAD-binding protein [Armatimonadota bacterium]
MPLSRYLVARLTEAVGRANATTDPLDLMAYEYDGALERSRPEIVLFPTTTQAVVDVLSLCYEKGVPVTPRGSGTCLSGGPVPLRGGVSLVLSRMDKLLEMDVPNQRVIVQPGHLNFDLIERLAKERHLYAPDPASQRVCTMGGNIAENSGGPHCLKYGVTTNHVTGLQVVLPDGGLMTMGGKALEAPGYDLRGVMIGSEGTLGVVTEITCRILPLPESVVTMLAIYDSIIKAAEAVSGIIAAGMIPATLEMMDRQIIRAVEAAVHAGYPLDAEAVLIIELDGMAAGLEDQVRQVQEICTSRGALRFEVAADEAHRDRLWRGRKGAFGAVARIAPNKITTDIAVPRTELPRVLAEVIEIGKRHGLDVGNVFHAGDGNLHPQLLFDDRNPDEVARVLAADKEIAKLAVEVGGVLTGEHGIGCQKAYAMPMACAPQDLAAMRALKDIFDPQGTFNPGKVLPPPNDAELQLHPPPCASPLPASNDQPVVVESYAEAAAILAEVTREQRRVVPVGGRTKVGDLGAALPLDSRALRSIVDYDWENLTVTAQAGLRVAELQAALAEHGQFAPLTAPFPDRATLGGLVAANSNGPLRYGYGELRDVLLGVRFATCGGQVVTSGSKTVKNVCGYDVKRLLVGSGGSLGMIVEATFRTLPLPPAESALLLRIGDFPTLAALSLEVRTSHLLPSALEAVNPALWNLLAARNMQPPEPDGQWRLLFALRGCAADVVEMRAGLTEAGARFGPEPPVLLDGSQAAFLWRDVAEASRLLGGPFYGLKAVVPPAEVAPLVAAASTDPSAAIRVSAGSGSVHIVVPTRGDPAALGAWVAGLETAAREAGGWLGPDAPPGSARDLLTPRRPDCISKAIKAAFDPAGVLPAMPL